VTGRFHHFQEGLQLDRRLRNHQRRAQRRQGRDFRICEQQGVLWRIADDADHLWMIWDCPRHDIATFVGSPLTMLHPGDERTSSVVTLAARLSGSLCTSGVTPCAESRHRIAILLRAVNRS
jgi:hypothetical protein